jgi:hypothetical protein
MTRSLEDLVSLPGAASSNFGLGSDQRRLIVNVVSNSSLKATAVLTSLTSVFNAFIVLLLAPRVHLLIILSVATCLLIFLLAWMYPQSPQELSEKSFFGLERSTLIILIFCGFDALAAWLSLLTNVG